jgi:hypothetical protein
MTGMYYLFISQNDTIKRYEGFFLKHQGKNAGIHPAFYGLAIIP